MAAGHPEAWAYPIGFLWDESNIVLARDNSRIHTELSLLQTAMTSIFSKEGRTAFKESMGSLYTKAEAQKPPERPPHEE